MPGDRRLNTLLASEDQMGAKRELVGKILIADDDPDFRRMLVRRAERMGLNVTEVSDGTKAIAELCAPAVLMC